MTAEADVVKQSDLLNQLVLDRNNMEELGRVDVLWMYPAAHRVLGFICKSGFLGAKKIVFKLPQIQTLGANSILVHSQPEETDADKVKQLDSLLNCEVWSDAGNKIGRITDYRFQLKTGEITQYLFVSSGWSGITGDIYQLPPGRIISFGRKRVLVPEAAVKSFELYRPGIKQTLSKARDILKDDYISLVKQAKERAQAIAEQAKETAQTFTEQLKEETQTFTEQAKTTSQTVAEQVKERTQTVVDQANTGFQSSYQTSQAPTTPEPAVSQPPVSPPPPTSTPQPPATATTRSFADEEEDDPWDFLEEDDLFTPTSTTSETFRKVDTNTKTNTKTNVDIEDDDDEPWI